MFQATVGIDDSVRETGSVQLSRSRATARRCGRATFAAASRPTSWSWTSAGVKRLEIVADYGDDLDIGDRLDLGDAQVTK